MPTPAERHAFLYLALVTVVGTAVRIWDSRVPGVGPAEAGALAAQLAAVDSALARRAGADAAKAGDRRPGAAGRGVVRVPSTGSPIGPVDADQADSAALERLPGIGPALAARIVADRQERGAFGSLVGLQRVRGIGPGMARRLGGLVTFSGVSRAGEPATARRSP